MTKPRCIVCRKPHVLLADGRCRGCTATDSWPKARVELIGHDGNAFGILARCRKAAQAAGWPAQRVDAVLDEMRAGDYDHLLATVVKFFDVR